MVRGAVGEDVSLGFGASVLVLRSRCVSFESEALDSSVLTRCVCQSMRLVQGICLIRALVTWPGSGLISVSLGLVSHSVCIIAAVDALGVC